MLCVLQEYAKKHAIAIPSSRRPGAGGASRYKFSKFPSFAKEFANIPPEYLSTHPRRPPGRTRLQF